jgi:hypothetical protein
MPSSRHNILVANKFERDSLTVMEAWALNSARYPVSAPYMPLPSSGGLKMVVNGVDILLAPALGTARWCNEIRA